MKKLFIGLLLLSCVALFCACQKKDDHATAPTEKKLTVVTTLFPLYDFARAVGGERADVTLLLPPGLEPHSFEPKPADVMKVNKADIFVFTNEYMEPWAKSFINGLPAPNITIVDTSKGVTLLNAGPDEENEGGHGDDHHHHGGMDPHIWLDFANAQIMVDNILSAMVVKDPANRNYYTSRAVAYKEELKKLDDEYRTGLAGCGKRLFLHGGHYAFGYLARRYGLQYQSASAVNADAEPTPAKLAELVKLMRATGLKYVYSEELLSTRSADTIAKETGATVLLLHGAHNISKDDFARGVTFIALMKKNLVNLRTGLECR
jgi:zinc transport system substrate-binding protein